MVMAPCEPLLFSHVLDVSNEQLNPACHHQTNGFTLSRPRDFISALTKERDSGVGCRSVENSETSTTSWENSSTSLRDQSPSQTQANSYNCGYTSTDTASRYHLRTQPEDQSPLTSTMASDCRVTKFREYCYTSSTGRDEALNQNGEVYSDTEETEKRDG